MDTKHHHDGIEQDKITPATELNGFPIFRLPGAPTHSAQEGTQIYVVIPGAPDTYFLYVMIDQVWRGVNLPL